jgi:hypothetical protein
MNQILLIGGPKDGHMVNRPYGNWLAAYEEDRAYWYKARIVRVGRDRHLVGVHGSLDLQTLLRALSRSLAIKRAQREQEKSERMAKTVEDIRRILGKAAS